MSDFTDPLHFLGRTIRCHVDRPLGSRHPEWGFIYPVNYGFVPGQPAPDGEGLDVYILGVFEPLTKFTGRCIAVLHRLDDEDDKLILVSEGKDYTDEQIMALVEFQERFFKSVIIKEIKPDVRFVVTTSVVF